MYLKNCGHTIFNLFYLRVFRGAFKSRKNLCGMDFFMDKAFTNGEIIDEMCWIMFHLFQTKLCLVPADRLNSAQPHLVSH